MICSEAQTRCIRIFCCIIILYIYQGNVFSSLGQLTLMECRDKAYTNYPLIRKYDLIEKGKEYTLSNISKGFFPQVALSARATWQSDVTSVPFSLPGITIPDLAKDQYLVQLEANQLVYDGGRISIQKKLASGQAEMDLQDLQVDMYSVYKRIDELFFGILLLKDQIILNDLLRDDLNRNFLMLQSSFKLGIATQAELDELEVAVIETDQQRIELESASENYRRLLALMIAVPYENTETLVRPSAALESSLQNKRPELAFIDAAIRTNSLKLNLIRSSYLPVISVFAQGLYGRPTLNMFDNKLGFAFLGGLRFSYSFGNLYTLKHDKLNNEIAQLKLEAERNTFLFNTNLELNEYQIELRKIEDLMRQDDEIIRLRKNVVKASENKLLNGIIGVNDLIRDIHAENKAQRQKLIHQTQLLQLIWKIKYLMNN